jgi:AcrR family transcriptional regulator
VASLRNSADPDLAVLLAARDCILEVGWRRTTLTDVARRAGVSRMTLYRRWTDMPSLLADLMTLEWSGVLEDAALDANASSLDRLAGAVTATVSALRENELFRRIVHVDPELLLPYVLDRRGRTQDSILGLLEAAIRAGQQDGSIRAGDPTLLARSLLLTAHGFALSVETMADGSGPSVTAFDAELRRLTERYLRP